MKKLLKLQEVKILVSFGHSKIYALMKEGSFPSPVKIGERSVRWRSDDVTAWIDGLPEREAAK